MVGGPGQLEWKVLGDKEDFGRAASGPTPKDLVGGQAEAGEQKQQVSLGNRSSREL